MNTIIEWDHLEDAVDRLAHILDQPGPSQEELLCSLDFTHAEALAEILDAGHHPDTAARLMHRWALTEPDWDTDTAHSPTLERWLAHSITPQTAAN